MAFPDFAAMAVVNDGWRGKFHGAEGFASESGLDSVLVAFSTENR
jgi:hypothetical protein